MKKMKLSFLSVQCALLLIFPCTSYSAENLDEFEFLIMANIVSESCGMVIDGDEFYEIPMPDITMAQIMDIKKAKNYGNKRVNGKISFSCSSGAYAKFTLTSDETDRCKSDNGFYYTCSGENKTVGLAPWVSWVDKDNNVQSVNEYKNTDLNNNAVRTLKLDDQTKIGSIDIPSVFYRTVAGLDPVPGKVSARFRIKIWSD